MTRNFKKNFENYFVIGLAGVLLIIVFIISIITTINTTPKQNPTTDPNPSNAITPLPSLRIVATVPPKEAPGVPAVSYDNDATDRLIETVQNRPVLSQPDEVAKQKIITLLPPNETSGYVHRSPTINIEYLKSPDVFLVEILTIDVAKAKADANTWFRTQGLSQKGICSVPVSFYINWSVAQQLRNTNFLFNPLPNSC